MGRETGLEPATSSLGIFTSIDFKEHGAYRDAYRPKQNSNPADGYSKTSIIGGLMEGSGIGSRVEDVMIRVFSGTLRYA
jgi:hypothetical protein